YLFLYIFILLFFFFSFLLPLLTSTLFPYTTLFRSYGLVRSLKPRRYVEVGCGWSSLLLQKALQKNDSEGASTEVALVEPYPNENIFAHLPKTWPHHRCIIQRAPFAVFDQLEAGDIFFYDGSHC